MNFKNLTMHLNAFRARLLKRTAKVVILDENQFLE